LLLQLIQIVSELKLFTLSNFTNFIISFYNCEVFQYTNLQNKTPDST
jgi:hypothetical protein